MTPEQRRQYLLMAERRAKRGSGSDPRVLRERTEAFGSPDLRCLLGRVEFVVVGGLATRLYMPERMTLDVDILIRRVDVLAVEAALRGGGFEKKGGLSVGGSTWSMGDRGILDVVALDEPWVEEALRAPVRGKDGLPYIALPYLVLMKLGASRAQDLADISRMLGGAGDEAIEQARRLVRLYRSQDIEDLNSLIRLGQLEYEE